MSENVKIKILEMDKTKGAGRPTDSSDVAFIPGLSIGPKSDKFVVPKNTPVLCTTVDEFENYFGSTPYKYTANDVAGYTSRGYISGDYDKSYIFAKELLYQGMPIYYANVGFDAASVSDTELDITGAGIFIDGNHYTDASVFEEISRPGPGRNLTVIEVSPIENFLATDVLKPKTYSKSISCSIFNAAEVDSPALYSARMDATADKQETDGPFKFTRSVGRADELVVTVELGTVPENESVTGQLIYGTFNYIIDWSTIPDTINKIKVKFYDGYSTSATSTSQITAFYYNVSTAIDLASDKSLYSIKYLTSGGYPSIYKTTSGSINSTLGAALIAAAKTRGDAVALIDYQMTTDQSIYNNEDVEGTVYEAISSINDEEGYGAAMYPWGAYTCSNGYSGIQQVPQETAMPASYAYLMCVARAIKFSPSWLAMAGVSRGVVPGIKGLYTKEPLTNTIAENLQPKYGKDNHETSINCITNIRPYGLTLWGNRTLKKVGADGTVAQNFLNIRNMISDIKKVLYSTGKSLMFEQNTETLWLKFKSGVSPLLDGLVSGGALENYKIIKGTKRYDGNPLTKGELAAVVKIYPTYAVEYFELVVEINDSDVTVG